MAGLGLLDFHQSAFGDRVAGVVNDPVPFAQAGEDLDVDATALANLHAEVAAQVRRGGLIPTLEGVGRAGAGIGVGRRP